MTTYYIEQNGVIVLHDTDRSKLENTLRFMPQYEGLTVQETERPIENCEWADTEEYIAAKHKREVEAQVAALEAETGLTRPLRETILDGKILVSEYVLNKIQQIESLAAILREEVQTPEEPGSEL